MVVRQPIPYHQKKTSKVTTSIVRMEAIREKGFQPWLFPLRSVGGGQSRRNTIWTTHGPQCSYCYLSCSEPWHALVKFRGWSIRQWMSWACVWQRGFPTELKRSLQQTNIWTLCHYHCQSLGCLTTNGIRTSVSPIFLTTQKNAIAANKYARTSCDSFLT